MSSFTCEHDNPVRPEEAFTDDQCRHCWLRATGALGAARIIANQQAQGNGYYREPLASHRVAIPIRLPCIFEGPILEWCKTCNPDKAELRHVRDCEVFESCVRDKRAGSFAADMHSCHDCTSYRRWRLPPQPGAAGVVLGCYGWPKLIRLQIRVIREACGNLTPILVHDDASPAGAEIAAVCEQEMVEFATMPARLGHYAGDLAAIRRGIEWGQRNKLAVVVKVSQRLLITKPDWLHEVCQQLMGSDAETAAAPITEGREKMLYWRTEALACRVDKWVPQLHRLQAEVLNGPTELACNHMIMKVFEGRILQWGLLEQNRYRSSPGTLWHCADSHAAYVELAKRHGLELDADFSTAGRNNLPDWKRG